MKSNSSTWWVWAIVAVVLLGALGTWAWLLLSPSSPSAAPTTSVSASPTATGSTPIPTRTTIPATTTPQPTATPTATSTPIATPTPTAAPEINSVSPFVVAADWDDSAGALSISANVPQVVESDGSCTFTASLGGASVSDSFAATPSADSTDCGTHSLSSTDFTSGEWTVVVSYSSATSAGTSTYSRTVTIP